MPPCFRVDFHYRRIVSCVIESESESDIDQFLLENEGFDILEDFEDLVVSDSTFRDPDDELGDYEVVEAPGVRADYTITSSGELVEIEHE